MLDKANDFYAVALDNGKTGWVTAGDVKPTIADYKAALAKAGINAISPDANAPGGIYTYLIHKAEEMRDTYKNNPYVQVSGFAISVPIPSIELSFTFK